MKRRVSKSSASPRAVDPQHRERPPAPEARLTAKSSAPEFEKIERKWAWHYRTLLDLREKLIRASEEHSVEAAEAVETHGVDVADSANEELDRDVILAELRAEGNELSEIAAAIQRLHDRTYGVCEDTGKPIPAERLRAVPWTRYSRPAAERLERGAQQKPGPQK
jgi:RNA polymerase-binding transcription factor DksA